MTFYNPKNRLTPSQLAELVYREINFCTPSVDNFYQLLAVETVYPDKDELDPIRNTTRYSCVASTVGTNSVPTANDAYVAVSFAFQSLSKQTITYQTTYAYSAMLGDVSGLVGALLGLDAIKVISGISVAWVSWKHRTIVPLERHFL